MATVHLLTSVQKMFVFTSVFITAFHPARGSCPGQGGKRKCGTPSDDDTGQLKCSDAGLLCAGISDAVSTQKEAEAAAPGHRQKATSGDNEAQKAKKARVAPKGK